MKALLKQLDLGGAVGIDFETYYDNDYSLRKMSTTEYIVDPRFEMQMASVRWHNSKVVKVLSPSKFKAWCTTVDWKRTGMLAHHAQFDGLIMSHHFGIKPAFYLDTLSMARPVMPVQVGGSLKAVTEAFGRPGKVHSQALADVKGRHLADFSPAELRALQQYAGDDIDDTWFIFHKLLPYLTVNELRVIDLTIKMYAQPSVLINEALVQSVYDGAVASKAATLKKLKLTAKELSSNEQFARLLEREGVRVPTKISKTTGKETLALSKQDLEFKALAKHPKRKVRDLVEARLGIKSTITETRSQKMVARSALGAVPIYLKYYGAKTGRWSGGDAINFQNLTRKSDMRKAIHAPPGHVFIIADQAQIEARINAWFAGQQDVVAAFARKEDVYKLAASKTYGKPVDKITKDERFVGKVQTLALGYQASGPRFADMLRLGQYGPPMDISDSLSRDWVAAWRQSNHAIVSTWRETNNLVKSAFLGKQRVEHGCVAYEGTEGKGFMHLPNGMSIRYDMLNVDESGDLSYVTRYRSGRDGPVVERTKLYGGILVENRTQALARTVLAEQMVQIAREMPRVRIATSTHDEVLCVAPIAQADKVLRRIIGIMTTPPDWATGLPFGVDAKISEIYDKE